jgi:hypothetical protein
MKNVPRTIMVHTWYGLNAATHIERASWHRTGSGRFLIPHPPLVNGLLRRGLSDAAYRHLCVWHEIGHLQMFPFSLLYAGLLLGIFFSGTFSDNSNNIFGLLIILISCFAFWEMLAEGYVLMKKAGCYHLHYKGVSIAPRLVFWSVMATLALAGWLTALA